MSSRDYTYRYSVRVQPVRGSHTPAGWDTRSRAGRRIPAWQAGKPTPGKLAQWVADFNASVQPGGVNEHLGPDARLVAASIYDHQIGAVVATWARTNDDQ